MRCTFGAKSIIALFLALTICLLSPLNTFALSSENNDTEQEILSIIEEINATYGTNFHVLSSEELSKYGMSKSTVQTSNDVNLSEFEAKLRYIAEVKIPQFERTTQEALASLSTAGLDSAMLDKASSSSALTSTQSSSDILASAPIDYATAAATASITTDKYGNTIWGSISGAYCYSNMYQEIWFLSMSPHVTKIDGGRTLYWTGTGDYCSYIDGKQIYLYSGTQYAEMYVGSYI